MTPVLTSRAGAERVAEQLRMLAHPARLRILSLLSVAEQSVGDIQGALGLKQPGLSQQLAELRQAGMVSTRRPAKSVFYQLANERDELLLGVIERLVGRGETDLGELGAPRVNRARADRPGEAAMFGVVGAGAGAPGGRTCP